ncbi:hypothetical protein [Alicyclobacillus ferrooxydans]|uniref:Uncharacterized protein n=1 Tax=Alicyclobacillus ferrooxydans TaxID=471514 RepID=A0A0P9CJP7_9BACL|nr:hypothetical protein [Alicyclobacillus ferrooxydans]KPV45529.1 hypothetical protein AN477_00830 [Alicyclobacillus ferrooxydans]
MKDAKVHALILSVLSISSIGAYLAMFQSVSTKTAKAMTISTATGQNAQQELTKKQQELQSVLQQLQNAQGTLQTTTQNYQQAYSVSQQDDQVLQVLNQRLQGMGLTPVPLPASPKPLQGIQVSSTPPPIVTTSGGS